MIALPLFLFSASFTLAQEKYARNGISFDYEKGWELKESTQNETDEIALANTKADAQITIIVVKQSVVSKDAADARKRIVDPWLQNLETMYTNAKIKFVRTEVKTDAGGMSVGGVQLKLDYDGQGGQVQVCWVLFEKRLLLLYMIRPDAKADKADPTWEKIRRSIRVATQTTK